MRMKPFISLGACGLVVSCGYSTPHPTDDELRGKFDRERAGFERLAVLFEEYPQLLAIGKSWGTLQDGVHERRVRSLKDWAYEEPPLREFGAELDRLGIKWGLQHCRQTPNQWMLFTNCHGLHPNSTCKGYIWSSDSLHPIRESLDVDPAGELDEYDRAYVMLDERWYLLYEIWPGYDDRCLPRKHG